MKICVPFNSFGQVKDLLDSSADELYSGLNTEQWVKRYGHIISSNRRYHKESQLKDLKEFNEAVAFAHKKKKVVNLALNAHSYTEEQLSLIGPLLDSDADNFIVSDVNLMMRLNKIGKSFHVSTGGNCINTYSARFFERIGAKRIILPRMLDISEIKKIRKATRCELEVFMLFDTCKNEDGYCNYMHGCEEILGTEHGCIYLNEFKTDNFLYQKRIEKLEFPMYCAACAIKEFEKIGIDAVKITGRRFPTHTLVKGIAFIRSVIDGNDPHERYNDFFNRKCPRNNCNYTINLKRSSSKT
jgi:U32 family peptidase